MPDLNAPLAGLTVLDFSSVLSGPLAAAMLADQGADVIKIEGPEGDTTRALGPAKGRLSAMYISANRGKRGLVLDLKQPAAQQIAQALVRRADVLIQNMRPGVMERLGLGAEAMLAANPRLVYLSITGFGPDGPDAGARAYDTVIQARSGLAANHPHPVTGEPTLLPSAVCDKLTALTAAQAVTAALVARARDGRGRHVQVAMLDAAVAFQWPEAMFNQVFIDEPPPPMPEFGVGQRPWATRDGFVATSAPQQVEFSGLLRVLGCPELADDLRFATPSSRMRNSPVLRELLTPRFATWATDELVPALAAAGVPAGRVNRRDELLRDPQLLHNGVLSQVQQTGAGTVRLPRGAARFDGYEQTVQPAPHAGEHGPDVLREAGFSDEQIQAWLSQGVLRVG